MKPFLKKLGKLGLMALPAMFLAFPALAQDAPPAIDKGDTAWMIVASVLVLMMSIPGLALFYGGLVRKDNILATMMQTFSVCALVSLVWPMVGYSIAFGEDTPWFGGFDKLFLKGLTVNSVSGTIPETVFIMFQLTFAIITCAILLGAVADRIKFSAVMLFTLIWVLAIYSPIAHWVWGPSGVLGGVGAADYTGLFGLGKALDFAGGTVVHISSGVSGLVAALYLGKSLDKKSHTISNNFILSIIGAGMLWVGWFGFNAGSAVAAGGLAGMAMLVTNTAAASGALAWILLEWTMRGKPSVLGLISGAVAGLVAITPASGFVGFGAAVIIGAVGAGACLFAVSYMKEKLGYDDLLDAFGIHGIGGMTGALLTGVFAEANIGGTAGLLEGNAMQLAAQAVSVVVTAAFAGAGTWVILKVLDMTIGVRVNEDIEHIGLDLALHGNRVHVY